MLQHIPCAAAMLALGWVSVWNSANTVTQLCREGQVSQVPPACATAAVPQLGWASKCTRPCSLCSGCSLTVTGRWSQHPPEHPRRTWLRCQGRLCFWVPWIISYSRLLQAWERCWFASFVQNTENQAKCRGRNVFLKSSTSWSKDAHQIWEMNGWTQWEQQRDRKYKILNTSYNWTEKYA